MPQTEFRLAEDLVDACDAMLLVGTSGVVFPAAELPINAHQLGKFVAEINPERSAVSGYTTVACQATAAEGLPKLLSLLRSACAAVWRRTGIVQVCAAQLNLNVRGHWR